MRIRVDKYSFSHWIQYARWRLGCNAIFWWHIVTTWRKERLELIGVPKALALGSAIPVSSNTHCRFNPDSDLNLGGIYAYGNRLNTPAAGIATTNPFRYDSGYLTPNGIYHFGARYYNPSVSAWTQLDPSGQNPGYDYANDDPINLSDPAGTYDDLGYVSAGFSTAAAVSDAIPGVGAPVGLTLGAISVGLSLANTIGDCASGYSDCGEDVAVTAIDALTFGSGASFAQAGDDVSAGVSDAAGAVTDAVTSIF